MPSLFYEDKVGEELEYVLPPGVTEVKIGRSAGNELRIRSPSISRNHASLLVQNGQYQVVDGGSSNGTFLNGKRIQPNRPEPVSIGDKLKFGEVNARFEECSAAAAPKLTLPYGAGVAPPSAAAPPLWPAPPLAATPLAAGGGDLTLPLPPQREGAPPARSVADPLAQLIASGPEPGLPPRGSEPLTPGPTAPKAEPPRPRTMEAPLDLSHLLGGGPPPPTSPPKDPLAGLFQNLARMETTRREPDRKPAPSPPSAQPTAAPPELPVLPKPGEAPVELNLEDLIGVAPEGQIIEIEEPTGLANVPDEAMLERIFGPTDSPGPGATPPDGLAAPPPVAADAGPFNVPGFAPRPGGMPDLALIPPAEPLAPPLPTVDPTLSRKLTELEAELESRRIKIDNLQKAARRDAELKQKLQEEKTDLEVQLTALRAEVELQGRRLEEERARLTAQLTQVTAQRSTDQELRLLQEQLQDTQERFAELEADRDRLQEAWAQREAASAALQAAQRQGEQQQQQLQARAEQAELQIAILNENLKRQAETLAEEARRQQESLLMTAGEAERQEIVRLQGRVNELEELLAEATSDSERLNRQVEELTAEQGRLREALEREREASRSIQAVLLQEREAAQAMQTLLQNERELVRTGQSLLQHERETLQQQIRTARAELEEASSERDSLILRVEELEETLARRPTESLVAGLQKELEALRESAARRNAEYMGHVDMLLGDKNTLEAQLREVQAAQESQLATLRAACEQQLATAATAHHQLSTDLEQAHRDAALLQEQLRTALDEARQDATELRQQLAALPDPAEIAELELELTELRRASDLHEQRAREQDQALQDAALRLDEFKAKAKESFQNLAEELAGLEEELEHAQAELEARRQTETELLTQIAELQTASEELRRGGRQLERELQKQLQSANEELEKGRQTLAAQQQTHAETLARTIREHEQAAAQLNEELEETRALLAEVDGQLKRRPSPSALAEAEQARQQLGRQVEQLEEELAQFETQARDASKALRRTQTELEQVHKERNQLAQQVAALTPLTDQVARLESIRAELEQDLATRPGGEELQGVREQLHQAREQLRQAQEAQTTQERELERLRNRLTAREQELEEIHTTSSAAQQGLGTELTRLKEIEIRLTEERDQLAQQLDERLAEREAADQQIAALNTQCREQQEIIEELQVAMGEAPPSQPSAPPHELEALRQQLAEVQRELETARANPPASADASGSLDAMRSLFQDINDTVSGWRNSFMQVGNYLLDLQNGLETLRRATDVQQSQAALEDIDRAGSIEEHQETLRSCEDDTRRIKREMIRYRDLLKS